MTVTIPAEIADTDKLPPKSIFEAVPTVEPSSFIITPEDPAPEVVISTLATPPEIVAVTPAPIKFIVEAVPTLNPSS